MLAIAEAIVAEAIDVDALIADANISNTVRAGRISILTDVKCTCKENLLSI